MMRFRSRSLVSILFMFGAFLLIAGYMIMSPQGGTGNWSSTDGIVIGSDITSYGEWEDGRLVTFYEPIIYYTYEVDGSDFTSTTISPYRVASSDRSVAEDYTSKYPTGSTVKVYYNPDFHGESVLERGGSDFGQYMMIIGGALFAIGIVKTAHVLLKRRSISDVTRSENTPVKNVMTWGPLAMFALSLGYFLLPFLMLPGLALMAVGAFTLLYLGYRAINDILRRSTGPGSMKGDGQTTPTSNDEVVGLTSAIKNAIFDPDMPVRLSDRLNSMGIEAMPLLKDSPEMNRHRYGHGILGDPVIAAVRVEGMNFDSIEVWRVNPTNRGTPAFVHLFVYTIKGDTGEDPNFFNSDLNWKVGKNSEVEELIWEGGRVGEILSIDTELDDMIINNGLPGVHIGKPFAGNYMVRSIADLGYIAVQLLPRDGELRSDGVPLVSQIGYGRNDLPDRRAIELADRIALHVRRLMNEANGFKV